MVTFWNSAPTGWTTDYRTALAQAKNTGKLVLADFTGSDWCGYCKKLKKEVFETERFKSWAKDKYVLLYLDYPSRPIMPHAIRYQNEILKSRYNDFIQGYPTILFLDGDGMPVGMSGYGQGGPDAWIAMTEESLSRARSKQKS